MPTNVDIVDYRDSSPVHPEVDQAMASTAAEWVTATKHRILNYVDACPPLSYPVGTYTAVDGHYTQCQLSATGPGMLKCGKFLCAEAASDVPNCAELGGARACPEHYESVATTSVLGCEERICRKKGLDPPVYYCGKHYCAPHLNQLNAGFLDRDSAHPCPSGYHAKGTVDGTWPFSYMECRK